MTTDDRLAAIERSFAWLVDLGYVAQRDAANATITYERDLVSLVVQVVVVSPSDGSTKVTLRWPDQAFPGAPVPFVTLDELDAMLGPFIPTTAEAPAGTLDRHADRLRALARDALHGGLSVLVDALVWHREGGRVPADGAWWASAPYDDPTLSSEPRRTADDLRRDLDFCDLKLAWRTDPAVTWPTIVAFVREHPSTSAAEWLLEDVILEGDEAQLDALIEQARTDARFAMTVTEMHLGGFGGPAVDRVVALQEELASTS